MKFLTAKNDNLFCFYNGCGGKILFGEPYVGIFFVDKEGRRRTLIFHIECYCKWYSENIFHKYEKWKSTLTEPKKRGRPKLYQDGKKVHRVKTLLYYHRKVSNEDKIQELQSRLSELRA